MTMPLIVYTDQSQILTDEDICMLVNLLELNDLITHGTPYRVWRGPINHQHTTVIEVFDVVLNNPQLHVVFHGGPLDEARMRACAKAWQSWVGGELSMLKSNGTTHVHRLDHLDMDRYARFSLGLDHDHSEITHMVTTTLQ